MIPAHACLAAATILTLHAGAHAQPAPDEIDWVRRHAVPLTTVRAGNGSEDLQPLRELFRGVRVVGLGEATHGTREHFQMKHRLVEFLASEFGYTVFSIEASTPEAFLVDEYVSHGRHDPARLIGGMYFWTWNTQEVLDMVEWMRAFNLRERDAGSGKSIRFTGFDMQETRVARRIVSEFVEKHDPDFAPTLVEKWASLGRADAMPSGGFGTATGTFPVDAAKGKRVTFRGCIKTRNVRDGYAGLWWRVDGPDHAQLAFDNMHDRGPRGTTNWQQYAITLDVPENALNISFGCLLTDRGTAWFDSLVIEIDGVPYKDDRFDLSFDGEKLKGLTDQSPGYRIQRDAGEACDGAVSLRISSWITPDAPRPRDSVPAARAVHDHLSARRAQYLDRGAGEKDVEWAIHNATIVLQWARMMNEPMVGAGVVRDESMARNVMWLLERDPDAKVVLWAHNYHISSIPGSLGGFLRDALGDQYLAVGFTAGEGTYYAMPGPEHRGFVHELSTPPPDSAEALFAAVGHDIFALDLRGASRNAGGAKWLSEPRPTRSIGAVAMQFQFHPHILGECFDMLVHTQQTSAARQLETRPGAYDPP